MYDKINKLVKKHKTNNPFALASSMGIELKTAPLGNNVKGIFVSWKRGMVITLNETLSEAERRIVLAHELGHAALHRKLNRVFMDKFTLNAPGRYENEADLFAAYLIISDDDITDYLSREYTIGQISKISGINENFVQKRINGYLKKQAT